MTLRITNLPQFEAGLQEFADLIDVEVDKVVRKIGFDLFSGIVSRTPVDTGWARASWNIAFNTPSAYVPPKPEDKIGFESHNTSQLNKLAGLDVKQTPKIWITNNLPYIVFLEAGHSKQMGKGYMIQRTITQVVSEFNATLRAIR